MRLSSTVLLASLALLLPAVAAAQTVPQTPPAQPVLANGLICKYYYYYNNVVRRPVCLTAEQWARLRYNTQENLREFQMRSYTTQP
jgi:hypothetical protein